MTTIKITDDRAILVYDSTFALAVWKTTKVKNAETGEYDTKAAWAEYKWCSSMDRAVDLLAQEIIADMELTVTMKEFKLHFQNAVKLIKDKING